MAWNWEYYNDAGPPQYFNGSPTSPRLLDQPFQGPYAPNAPRGFPTAPFTSTQPHAVAPYYHAPPPPLSPPPPMLVQAMQYQAPQYQATIPYGGAHTPQVSAQYQGIFLGTTPVNQFLEQTQAFRVFAQPVGPPRYIQRAPGQQVARPPINHHQGNLQPRNGTQMNNEWYRGQMQQAPPAFVTNSYQTSHQQYHFQDPVPAPISVVEDVSSPAPREKRRQGKRKPNMDKETSSANAIVDIGRKPEGVSVSPTPSTQITAETLATTQVVGIRRVREEVSNPSEETKIKEESSDIVFDSKVKRKRPASLGNDEFGLANVTPALSAAIKPFPNKKVKLEPSTYDISHERDYRKDQNGNFENDNPLGGSPSDADQVIRPAGDVKIKIEHRVKVKKEKLKSRHMVLRSDKR